MDYFVHYTGTCIDRSLNPVFDRIEKRKVLQTSVDVGLEHFLFIS